MDGKQYRVFAEYAAEKYYKHIDGLQKARKIAGMSESQVTSMYPVANSQTEYICHISAHLHSIDASVVLFRQIAVPDIKIEKYNMRRRVAILSLPRNIVEDPVPIQPSDFMIVSDLKFLIRRLQDFYHKTPICFSPPAPNYLPPHTFDCNLPLSAEQEKAVEGIFSYPVSYVWGPPGTGKTRFVLSECVLRYIANKSRILLLAPTNNSVEQMLRGVLPVLRESGIDLTCVYRMGTASVSFAREYPEVVGDSLLEKEIEDLNSQKQDLLRDLSFSKTYYSQLQEKQEKIKLLQSLTDAIHKYYIKDREAAESLSRAEDASQNVTIYRAQYEAAIESKSLLDEQLASYKAEIRSHCRFLRSDRRYGSVRYAKILRLTELFDLENNLSKQISEVAISIDKLQVAIAEAELNEANHVARAKLAKSEQQRILDALLSLPDLPTEIVKLFESLPTYSFDNCLSKYRDILRSFECDIFSGPQPRPVEDILYELKAVEKELLNISSTEKIRQKSTAYVIAATIDTIVKHLPPSESERFEHIFLDEAGYTSLMRGCVAFSCNCPVTFLGDHYQLPPICEIDQRMKSPQEPKITIDEKEISLFAMPCAYFSELFTGSMSEFYELYFSLHEKKPKEIPPRFDYMPMLPLTQSYRFNDTLARLLSKYVYHQEFYGVSKFPLEIIVLDAPNYEKVDKDRLSKPEEFCIAKYLSSCSDQTESSIGVLAPYKKQFVALKEHLQLPNDTIFTVHRSQGMEFDTVIFSVTDLPRDMFLVNSKLPQGRSLLNTAISRTKKKLVITCDVAYWSKQKDQLITELINIGMLQDCKTLPVSQSPALPHISLSPQQ